MSQGCLDQKRQCTSLTTPSINLPTAPAQDVANILLQILDEGTLTDSQGRKIDFRNTSESGYSRRTA